MLIVMIVIQINIIFVVPIIIKEIKIQKWNKKPEKNPERFQTCIIKLDTYFMVDIYSSCYVLFVSNVDLDRYFNEIKVPQLAEVIKILNVSSSFIVQIISCQSKNSEMFWATRIRKHNTCLHC